MYVLFSDASFNGNCFNELHEISLRASCSLVVCLQIMFSVYEDHASDKLYAQWWGMVVGELGGGYRWVVWKCQHQCQFGFFQVKCFMSRQRDIFGLGKIWVAFCSSLNTGNKLWPAPPMCQIHSRTYVRTYLVSHISTNCNLFIVHVCVCAILVLWAL